MLGLVCPYVSRGFEVTRPLLAKAARKDEDDPTPCSHPILAMTQPPVTQSIVIMTTQKSMGVALLLAFFFGPLGLLYASVLGGIVMFVLSVIVGVLTLGFGLLVMWPITVIWAAIAVNSHNKKLTSQIIGASR